MLIKRKEAFDKNFACIAGAFGQMDESGRKRIFATLEQEMQAGRRRLTEYEVVGGDTRIVMIGQMLKTYGAHWSDSHKGEMEWLAAQHLSGEQAIARADRWEAAKAADPMCDGR